jgi:hypothetical protein
MTDIPEQWGKAPKQDYDKIIKEIREGKNLDTTHDKDKSEVLQRRPCEEISGQPLDRGE